MVHLFWSPFLFVNVEVAWSGILPFHVTEEYGSAPKVGPNLELEVPFIRDLLTQIVILGLVMCCQIQIGPSVH